MRTTVCRGRNPVLVAYHPFAYLFVACRYLPQGFPAAFEWMGMAVHLIWPSFTGLGKRNSVQGFAFYLLLLPCRWSWRILRIAYPCMFPHTDTSAKVILLPVMTAEAVFVKVRWGWGFYPFPPYTDIFLVTIRYRLKILRKHGIIFTFPRFFGALCFSYLDGGMIRE